MRTRTSHASLIRDHATLFTLETVFNSVAAIIIIFVAKNFSRKIPMRDINKITANIEVARRAP